MLNEYELRKVGAAAGAATTAVTGDAVDMQNFKEATFFSTIATANAGNNMKIQMSDTSDFTVATNITGSTVVAAANGDIVAVTVKLPLKRYLRAVITRGVSTATSEIFVLKGGSRIEPVTNAVTGVVPAVVVSP